MKLIYLAGPIDQNHRIDPWAERSRARALLQIAEFTVYDPAFAVLAGMAAGLTDSPDPRVGAIHEEALSRADGVLALMPPGVASIGTPMEVERALSVYKIPVAIMGPTDSWYLAHRLGNYPATLLRCFPLEDHEPEALEWLKWAVDSREGTREATEGKPLMLRFSGIERLAPMQAHPGDAGFDVYISERARLEPGQTKDVPCGIKVALPKGFWGLLVGRSSAAKMGLRVQTAIIDNGYRGELFTIVQNTSLDTVAYLEPGSRLAQLIPIPLGSDLMRPTYAVELMDETDRGEHGFGSTGK